MFELIRANKIRSFFLLVIMFLLMLSVGFMIGFAVYPMLYNLWITLGEDTYRLTFPLGGVIGLGVALLIWGIQTLVAFYGGERLLMASAGASRVDKQAYPQLYNVVEEMAIAAQLPKPPKIYIIEDTGLNAFAAGRDPEHASVAVTAGLLASLDRNQLQGVVAHEIAHIVNRDILFMTMAGIMVGTITMISDTFTRIAWYSDSNRRYRSRRSDKGNGGGLAIVMIVALISAVVAPVIANLLYLACSRRREYLADASAAVYTRYPEGLASALEVIAENSLMPTVSNRVTAPMFIANPLSSGAWSFSALSSTHPPIEERIRILRSMGGGVSYAKYANAWKESGGRKAYMPASALQVPEVPMAVPRTDQTALYSRAIAGRSMAARSPQPVPTPAFSGSTFTPHPIAPEGVMAAAAVSAVAPTSRVTGADGVPLARVRQRAATGDIIRQMNQFRFIPCTCGITLKLPPNFSRATVTCPRCRKVHTLSSS